MRCCAKAGVVEQGSRQDAVQMTDMNQRRMDMDDFLEAGAKVIDRFESAEKNTKLWQIT
jgi:hypothetical protein